MGFTAPEVKDSEEAGGSLPGLMGKEMSAKEKYAERMKKLRDLHLKRNEARKLNHQEVLQEEALKAECDAKGKDWEIEKLRNLGADEADALDRRKKSKQNPDEGFSSYEQATFRKYSGLTKQIKPDMGAYEVEKYKAGDAFYAEAGTIVHGVHKDSKDAINKMAEDVIKQQEPFEVKVCLL